MFEAAVSQDAGQELLARLDAADPIPPAQQRPRLPRPPHCPPQLRSVRSARQVALSVAVVVGCSLAPVAGLAWAAFR